MTDLYAAVSLVSHREDGSEFSRPEIAVIELMAIFLLFSLSLLLPQPLRGALAAVAALGGPAWAIKLLLRSALSMDAIAAWAAGITCSIASWTMGEFLALEVGIRPTGTAAFALFCVLVCVPTALAALGGGKICLVGRTPAATIDRVRSALVTGNVRVRPIRSAAAGLVLIAASLSLIRSFEIAKSEGASSSVYELFWLGLVPLLAIVVVTAMRVKSPAQQKAMIFVLGLVLYLPGYLRAPFSPAFSDEFGHWGAAQELARSGHLYVHDPLVVIGVHYPGFESLVVAIHSISGISLYSSGILVIALLHGAVLVGVAVLCEVAFGSNGVASVASAALFGIGPQFIWFDTWYAYESLGLPLFIWATAIAVVALERASRRGLMRSVGVIVLLGAACAVTHHVSSYVLIASLMLLGTLGILSPSKDYGRERIGAVVILLAGVALGAFAVWWALLSPKDVLPYLTRPIVAGIRGVYNLVFHQAGKGPRATVIGAVPAVRHLFSGSSLPWYERYLAFASPPIALCLVLYTVVCFRRDRTAGRWLIAFLASGYFVTLPLALTSRGAAPAHRSWAFTYLGVSILGGVALGRLYERRSGESTVAGIQRIRRVHARRSVLIAQIRRVGLTWAVALLTVVVLIGNYGGNVSPYHQFPGPYLVNVDGRSESASVVKAARWLKEHYGPGARVIAPLWEAPVLFGYAQALDPSMMLSWELVFPETMPDKQVLRRLMSEHIEFLVLDRRLAEMRPMGFPYFSAYEPILSKYPLASASLSKFSRVDWTRRVYNTGPLEIFRINEKRLGLTLDSMNG